MMDLAARKVDLWSQAMAADPDVYEVAARVSTIPDTAAAVVRFANSAYVGAVYPVGTVPEAVIRIGCRSVGALAMASLNRELVDNWGAPELWEESLIVARAAKLVGRLVGQTRSENEHLFVAGLFSASGSAGLVREDDGYLRWRSAQWLRGVDELTLLKRERMAYGLDHVQAADRLLAEWNMPDSIRAPIASHHDPLTIGDRILRAAMTVVDADSTSRCVDLPLSELMGALGLESHVEYVSQEARLFAEVAMRAFDSADEPVA